MVGSLRTAPFTGLTNAVTAPQRGLIVADGLCPQITELLPGALHDVVALSQNGSPLASITAELAIRRLQGQAVDTLHVVAHGRAGAFQIGGQWISAAALITHAAELAQWQVRTVALWSCNVGADRNFVALLEELTGAEVLSSSEMIRGGANQNWQLRKGQLTAAPELTQPFNEEIITTWNHSLEVSFSPSVLYNVSATTTSTVTLGPLAAGATVAQDDPAPGEGAADTLFDAVSTDLLVRIVLSDGTIINGEIQRRITTGSTLEALVFFEDVNGDGSVVQGGEPGGRNFVIVRSGFESSFATTSVESTNSAPIRELVDALNQFLAEANSPINIQVLGATVSEGTTAWCQVTLSAPTVSPTTLTLQTTLGTAGITDFTVQPIVYYLDGSGNRVDLTPTASADTWEVTVPIGVSQIFVGYATTPDSDWESTTSLLEDFGVTASIPDGAGGSASAIGTVRINDSGQGETYIIDPVTNRPIVDTTAVPDDDRVIGVSDVTVNEGSPYAVFTLTGGNNQQTTLSLAGQGAAGQTSGLTALQYFDGANWQNYTPGAVVSLNGTGSLFVRVALPPENEPAVDNGETFKLVATNTGGTTSTGGTGTVKDDGTGGYFAADNNTATPNTPLGVVLDDDRVIGVSDVTVNEGSPYAVFTLTGGNNQQTTLSLAGQGAAGQTSGLTALQYFDGANWQNYTPGAVVSLNGTGSLFVRVALPPENEPAVDNGETFKLVATNTGGTTSTGGTGTVKDDGTGGYFAADNNTATPNTPLGVVLDDDRVIGVSDVTVNEGSPYAVFTLTGGNNQQTTLSLAGQGAAGQTSGLTALQYFDGANWQNYTPGAVVSLNGTGSLFVRVALPPENEPAVDNGETFKLVATNTGGTTSTGGTGTVKDDGTGGYFAADNNTATPNTPLGVVLDDDRVIGVSDVTVNEGSPYAVFTLTGGNNQQTTLSLAGQGAAGQTSGLTALQYFDGANWVDYTPGAVVSLIGTSLLVRVALSPEQETAVDNGETFTLVATNTGGTTSTGGTGTVKDDGTGGYFAANNNTGVSAVPPGVLLDDDRPPSRFTLRTDSDSGAITDRVTANGNPELQLIGAIGRSSELVIKYADDEDRVLTLGTNYTVREVPLADQPGKAIYVIDLIDANTGAGAGGNQAYGDYYQGALNTGNGGFGDGLYTVHYNGTSVGNFTIDTNPLSQARQLQCINQVFNRGNLAFESTLFGYRTEKDYGTKGDDILTGNATSGVSLNGNKGSDLLNGVGYRFNQDGTISNLGENKRDTLIGGKGADYFQLGDIAGSFYNQNGTGDYALIKDFSRGDRIILSGDPAADPASLYTARNTTIDGGPSGVGIYEGDDLIALVQGKARNSLLGTGGALNDSAVDFI